MQGIILEIQGDRCVVMKKDGSFEEIRNQNYAVGQEIRLPKPAYIKYLSAAACLMLVCTSLFGYRLYHTPVSFVYLDVNPSIRLDINRFERVINVVPLNEDAQVLLSSASISRKSAQECINDIVSACQEQQYLNEQNTDVEISVRTDDEELESSVETASASIGEGSLEVSVFQMGEEENDSAMEHHISAGRLRAVRSYTETFGGTLEKNLKILQGVSSDEIYEAIGETRRDLQTEDVPAVQVETASQNTEIADSSDPDAIQALADEAPQPNHPANGNHGDMSAGSHRLTTKRLKAIRAYTEQFGGTAEENAALLQGISSDDIYRMIDEANAGDGTAESPLP